jgi:hypothetical protein
MDVGTVLTVWYFVIFLLELRKTTKYHTVRPVPTSMKNNKIPHCQDSSNRKTTKYHTVRTVHCSDSVVFCYFSIRTVLTVVFCCFSWILELF